MDPFGSAEMWRTMRYAIATEQRTARLAVLMVIVIIIRYVLFHL